MKKLRISLAVLALVIASLACTQVTVMNSASVYASVQVTLPDGGGGLVTMKPNTSREWLVLEGGPYEVKVVPTERQIEFMKSLQAASVQAMFTGEAEGMFDYVLGPDKDPLSSFQAYVVTAGNLEDLQTSATCTGELPYPDPETFGFDLSIGEIDTEAVEVNFGQLGWMCNN
jgi:hypothetical protein